MKKVGLGWETFTVKKYQCTRYNDKSEVITGEMVEYNNRTVSIRKINNDTYDVVLVTLYI